jgi:hypothetical protein
MFLRYPHSAVTFPKEVSLGNAILHNKWFWIAVAVLVALAVAGAIVAPSGDKTPPSAGPSPSASSVSPTPPALRQAKWRVKTFPAAKPAVLTKKQRKVVHTEGLRASRGIEKVYNALFLAPTQRVQAVRSHFEQRAARAFLHTKTGLPQGLRRVQITYRSVRMGVDARTAQNAIAKVAVLLKGVRGSKRLKIRNVSTLWLERVHQSWKVLAFDAKRGPR